jgi:hypothetical protein
MPLAFYRKIDGKKWRLFAVVITYGNADIPRAKKLVEALRSKDHGYKHVRREKNVVYVRDDTKSKVR